MIASEGLNLGTALAHLQNLSREFETLEAATNKARAELVRLTEYLEQAAAETANQEPVAATSAPAAMAFEPTRSDDIVTGPSIAPPSIAPPSIAPTHAAPLAATTSLLSGEGATEAPEAAEDLETAFHRTVTDLFTFDQPDENDPVTVAADSDEPLLELDETSASDDDADASMEEATVAVDPALCAESHLFDVAPSETETMIEEEQINLALLELNGTRTIDEADYQPEQEAEADTRALDLENTSKTADGADEQFGPALLELAMPNAIDEAVAQHEETADTVSLALDLEAGAEADDGALGLASLDFRSTRDAITAHEAAEPVASVDFVDSADTVDAVTTEAESVEASQPEAISDQTKIAEDIAMLEEWISELDLVFDEAEANTETAPYDAPADEPAMADVASEPHVSEFEALATLEADIMNELQLVEVAEDNVPDMPGIAALDLGAPELDASSLEMSEQVEPRSDPDIAIDNTGSAPLPCALQTVERVATEDPDPVECFSPMHQPISFDEPNTAHLTPPTEQSTTVTGNLHARVDETDADAPFVSQDAAPEPVALEPAEAEVLIIIDHQTQSQSQDETVASDTVETETTAEETPATATQPTDIVPLPAAEASPKQPTGHRGRAAAVTGLGAIAAGLAIALHPPIADELLDLPWQDMLHMNEILDKLSELKRFFA